MMARITALAATLVLAGCDVPEKDWGADQCLRIELFQQCLKALPAGPQSTQYNDWNEVVAQCQNAAYYQSLRKQEFIKKECRA